MRLRTAAYTAGILASLATVFAVLFLDAEQTSGAAEVKVQTVQTYGSNSPAIVGTQGDVNFIVGSDE
ncbi:hypothetical protein [uncultured Litoreibacter sp.]|uniref:hypothetical protein n=1 Tax=uncultured Litoreibacter sp. TaxID=1392394 RepID=UPI0026137EE9|nr:hypothetical protein [uncultured Litoreibacter sp.]